MAHLFFDSATYPWYLNEAQELHGLLFETISDAVTINRIRRSCGPNVRPLARDAPDKMWSQLLDQAAHAGRLRELDRMLRHESVHIATALDKLIAAVSPDPATWLLDAPAFVNRRALRAALARLASAQTVRNVLVVRGEQGSGKSWTMHIIHHYARLSGQGCNYLCAGMVATVAEAVEYILSELEGETPHTLSTEAASYTTIAQAMIRAAQKRKCGSWIIMDDLGVGPDGVPLVEQEIRRLFDQLALNMVNPAFARWFKLVLIAYPEGPLPSKWRRYALEDRTAVADIDTDAVSEFLCAWAQRHGKTLADSDAVALAQDIIRKASAAPAGGGASSQLDRMHDELDIVLGKL